MTRILAVDAGEARIGLAVGEVEGRLAFPLAIIERKGRGAGWVAAAIARRAGEERADEVVVGLPLNIDGSEGPQAARARALGDQIALAGGLPVRYWDERMSSFKAEQQTAAHDARGRRGAGRVDDVAASVILQAYFDAQSTADEEAR